MAIFATYVYAGNTMSVSTTVLASLMINRIKRPIGRITRFYSSLVDIQVSLQKIHEFLAAEESQPNVFCRAENDDGEEKSNNTVVKIKGNFSFGFGGGAA